MGLNDVGYRYYIDSNIKKTESERMETCEDPVWLHNRLVSHTLAVSDLLEGRAGVWGEHSYARSRGVPADAHLRCLLQPRVAPSGPAAAPASPAEDDYVDVDTVPPAPPAPPGDHPREHPDSEKEDVSEDEWEERLVGAAPSAVHARVAVSVLEVLRGLRLRRLGGAQGRWARREGAQEAARRMRRALSAHWAGGARVPQWLHGVLGVHAPRYVRRVYDEVVGELRCSVPRLVERLGSRVPPAPADPLDTIGEPVSSKVEGPWVAWAGSGRSRWARRLGALLHVRPLLPPTLAPPPAGSEPPAAPHRWCADRAHAAQTALEHLLAEAGARDVVLCGSGGGASLATWLAGAGAGVRGAVLLAPPLCTAEGEERIRAAGVLAVVGGAGARGGGRGAAGAGLGPGGRALLAAGADDALRLPRAHRLRLNLPQPALDAAIAEECVRWIRELCAGDEHCEWEMGAASPPPAAEQPADGTRPPRRRGEKRAATSAGAAAAAAGVGVAGNGTHTNPHAYKNTDISDEVVVSRVSGGTPLSLSAPRRDLRAADIMRLPILFADDLSAPASALPAEESCTGDVAAAGGAELEEAYPPPTCSPPPAPITVRSGAGGLKYTRVIVAKRASRPRLPPVVVRRKHHT